MIAWWKGKSEFFRIFVTPMLVVGMLAIVVALMPIWSYLTSRYLFSWISEDYKFRINDQIKNLGTYGDMFGILNCIFSGAAFCAIYYTLRIQQKQHTIQEKELNMKQETANLVVDEVSSGETFQTTVPYGDWKPKDRPQCPANYVRIALNNEASMPAKNCRVMLTAIEKRKHGEEFSIIKESKITLRLLHFTEDDDSPEDKTITIPFNVPQYFNVCSIKKESPESVAYGLLQVAHGQSKYKSLGSKFDLNHDYRFFISVDSENSTPLVIVMIVSIGNDLDKLSVVSLKCEKKQGKKVYAE